MNEKDLQKKEDILDCNFYSEFSPHYEKPEIELTEKQGKLIAYGMLVLGVIVLVLLFVFDGSLMG